MFNTNLIIYINANYLVSGTRVRPLTFRIISAKYVKRRLIEAMEGRGRGKYPFQCRLHVRNYDFDFLSFCGLRGEVGYGDGG